MRLFNTGISHSLLRRKKDMHGRQAFAPSGDEPQTAERRQFHVPQPYPDGTRQVKLLRHEIVFWAIRPVQRYNVRFEGGRVAACVYREKEFP